LPLTAELAEETVERMIRRKILEAGHLEGVAAAAALRYGLDLGLYAHADDGRRDLFDDIRKTRRLNALDTNRLGQDRCGARGHRTQTNRASEGNGGGSGQKTLAG